MPGETGDENECLEMGLNSRTKSTSAQVCAQAKLQKASKELHFTSASDQRPHHSAARSWSRCRSGVSQCSNVGCIPAKWSGVAVHHAVEKDLSCRTTCSTGGTYKSSGMLPSGDQSVAAIIDESLQVLVRKGAPPKGGQLSTLWHSKVPNKKQSL